MSNSKVLNYPGILRAFNKIEECPEVENKAETLSALSDLIEKTIQKDLEYIRHQSETISREMTIQEEEITALLIQLEKNNIVLYEGVSNEEALIVKPHYYFNGNFKVRPNKMRYKTTTKSFKKRKP